MPNISCGQIGNRRLNCDGLYQGRTFAKLRKGGPNPFIDPDGYKLELAIDEAMFRAVLAEQRAQK